MQSVVIAHTAEAPGIFPTCYSWSDLIAAGIDAAKAEDNARFRLGDLALIARHMGGEKMMREFAREIGRDYATIRKYAWVAEVYPPEQRAKYEPLSFTHFQEAAHLPEVERDKVLARAQDDGLSTRQMAALVNSGIPRGICRWYVKPRCGFDDTEVEAGRCNVCDAHEEKP